jgi:hypothetical protein
MSTITIEETHQETTQKDIRTIVRDLNAALGPTLVALLAGVKDRKLPSKWAKADGPEPRPESRKRLQTADRVWIYLTAAADEHVARSWFIGLNPMLDEITPLEALNAGRDRDVIYAATAFVGGSQDT